MAWYDYGGWSFRPYVSVAEKKARAAKAIARVAKKRGRAAEPVVIARRGRGIATTFWRSEEHTSELQSHHDLVCRLLLEKKKKDKRNERQARRTGVVRGEKER